MAYVYNVNGYNLMGFTGYNWLRNRAFGRADMRQYHFGLGISETKKKAKGVVNILFFGVS